MIKSTTESGFSKLSKRKWMFWGVLAAALVAYATYGIVDFYSVGDEKEIITTSNSFKPGNDWKLITEDITPPKAGCIDTVCPELYREWAIPNKLDKSGFEKISVVDKHQMHVSDACFEEGPFGTKDSCDSSGTVGDYVFQITYYGTSSNSNLPVIQLTVQEKGPRYAFPPQFLHIFFIISLIFIYFLINLTRRRKK